MEEKINWQKDKNGDWTLNFADEIKVKFLTNQQKKDLNKIMDKIKQKNVKEND